MIRIAYNSYDIVSPTVELSAISGICGGQVEYIAPIRIYRRPFIQQLGRDIHSICNNDVRSENLVPDDT